MAKIELTLKMKGGSEVIMSDGTVYHFLPDDNDAHVAEVENPAHIARFMEVDGYVLLEADDEASEAARRAAEEAARAEADRLAAEEAARAEAERVAIEEAAKSATAAQQADTGAQQATQQPAQTDITLWTTELAALTHDELKAVYEEETKRKPHHRAGPEKLIELIIEHRTAATNED